MIKPLFADGSATALAKELYGKRLTDADYRALIGCPTVSAAAAKLAAFPGYGAAVAGIDPMTVPRGHLEQLLQGKLYGDVSRIRRYMEAAGSRFCDFFRVRFDVLQLIDAISALSGGEEYLIRLPDYFTGDSDLPLYALAEASSADGVLAAARGTPYEDVTRDAIEAYGERNDSLALYLTFASYLIRRFTEFSHGRDAVRLYRRSTDLDLLRLIYRVRSFDRELASGHEEAVRDVLSLPKAKTTALLQAPDTDAFRLAVRGTDYASLAAAPDFYAAADALQYGFARDVMRYSAQADAVTFAFSVLSQIESRNIIHIIEGIRFGLPRTAIEPLLVGYGESERR